MKRNFKKLSLLLALCLLMTVAIVGCGEKATEPGDTKAASKDDYKIVIRLSHVFSPAEQITKSLDKAAANILERTNGAVEIQTFPAGQIAVYKDGVEQVVRGADFISVEDPSYIGDYVPDFTALVGPMLYTSYDEYIEMTKTQLVTDLKAKAEEKGIKILALDYIFGFRNMITDKVIEKPEDLNGMVIRVPKSQLWMETLEAMGAVPTPLPWNETVPALQQNVIDGLEGSEFTNIGNKIYELKKNVAETKHFIGTAGVYISTDVFYGMPEEYQKIVEEEFQNNATENNNILKGNHADVVKELESYGVKFNQVDEDAFKKATAPIFDTFPGFSPGIYDKLQEELDKIRK